MHRLIVLSLFVTACAGARKPMLAAQVQPGPAAGGTPKRILMLEASCGSTESRCPREYTAVVDQIVRSTFEFSGYTIVPAEELRNSTRQRNETHETTTAHSSSMSTSDRVDKPFGLFGEHAESRSASQATTEKSTIVLDGPAFDDLSVTERQQVIAQAGADAVASVRIVIAGDRVDWDRQQDVEVMVRLGLDHGDALAWASRCRANTRDFSSVATALENAARCAVHGGTGR